MANNKVHKLQEELKDLAEQATYYGKQIVHFKNCMSGDPLHTRETYKWEYDWNNLLPSNQHYYAYYLFYKAALKRVEKEISKRKLYLKEEQQRANLPVRKTIKK